MEERSNELASNVSKHVIRCRDQNDLSFSHARHAGVDDEDVSFC